MACRRLKVAQIWAEDLKDTNTVRFLRKISPYVTVFLSGGDERDEEKQSSPVHKDGGTSPRWEHSFSFPFDESAALSGRLNLKFEIKAEKTIWNDREVGSVEVPVKKLLDQPGGDGEWKVATYDVWLPSVGKNKGRLTFSYGFDDLEAAGAGPAERPPPPMQGAAPCSPPWGYPTQGPPPQGPPQGYPHQGYAPHPVGHGPPLGLFPSAAEISAGCNMVNMFANYMPEDLTSGDFDA